MQRKERRLLFRITNAISFMALVISCIYLFFWGLNAAAITGVVVAICCIGGPIVVAGEGVIEILLGTLEALFHAVIDTFIGIFEAIGNALSSVA